MITLTKKFRFEAAHAILNYDGLCKNIHGHSYELLVTVGGIKNKQSEMVLDFKVLKKIVEESFLNQADHALFLNATHPKAKELDQYSGKKFLLVGEPTAENMIETIANSIKDKFPLGISLKKLRLYETESAYADWEPDPIG